MKNCIALIMAGGQGKRLAGLTRHSCKPAVPFGGKYRIIDFALSNCARSGFHSVGILTQYQSLVLNAYIRNGAAWGFNQNKGGVFILPPFITKNSKNWYSGTANAVYQNSEFIDNHDAEYVAIFSGDHIYNMNYSDMLDFHISHGGSATISTISVPAEDASRFGIITANSVSKITDFEEKPEHPKSNLASMGVYIFTWSALKKHLIIDENNENSSNDFGKDIIPQMLAAGENLFAYEFDGYWKDVGTVESLWQANMDLLSDNQNMLDDWNISSNSPEKSPSFIGEHASVQRSLIANGAKIYGTVHNSIVFSGAVVEPGALVSNSVIMANAVIGKNSQIERTIIGEKAFVDCDCHIGIPSAHTPQYKSPATTGNVTLISPNVYVSKRTIIGQNCMVENDISSFTYSISATKPEEEDVFETNG